MNTIWNVLKDNIFVLLNARYFFLSHFLSQRCKTEATGQYIILRSVNISFQMEKSKELILNLPKRSPKQTPKPTRSALSAIRPNGVTFACD